MRWKAKYKLRTIHNELALLLFSLPLVMGILVNPSRVGRFAPVLRPSSSGSNQQYDASTMPAGANASTSGKIYFPEESSSAYSSIREAANGGPSVYANEIPAEGEFDQSGIPFPVFKSLAHMQRTEDIVKLLDNAADVHDFYPDNTTDTLQVSIRERTASGVTLAQFAKCEPTPTVVDFEKSKESSVIYWPSCTRINRCGGCCSHDLLQCMPTKVEMVTMKVIQAKYSQPGTQSLHFQNYKAVEMEKHLECECLCRIRESDCTPVQVYKSAECRCVCVNEEREAAKCKGATKTWDSRQCRCRCKSPHDCSTGHIYNDDSCECEPLKQSRLFIPIPRFGGIYQMYNNGQNNRAAPTGGGGGQSAPESRYAYTPVPTQRLVKRVAYPRYGGYYDQYRSYPYRFR